MKKKEKSPFNVVNLERRKYPRFSVDLPAEYWKTYNPLGQSSRTINISEGGVLFHISEPVGIGENLKLKILTDSRLNSYPTEALVKVMWKDTQLSKEDGYRIGARFVEISQKDRDNLRKILDILTNLRAPSSKIFSKFASILTGFPTPNLLKPRIEKPGR